jgi:diadenylate cyclase
MKVLSWISEIGFSGFLDIVFIWFIIYTILVWSKKTKAVSVITGILIVAGVYLLTRQLNMILASGLLEKFFAIIIIALVVIFQEELRYFFEQIAIWGTSYNLKRRKKRQILSREEVDVLVRTLKDLAKDKIGALIVIRGKDLIVRHLDGGIELNGKLSEAILKSLFDASSIGHDGAVYIEGGKILKFSCHLPLSKNLEKVGKGGTRHSAALGLAELCDALCLVVSEERGTIAVARYGRLDVVSDIEALRSTIVSFYEEVSPRLKHKPWEGFFKKNYREKIMGFLLASVIWFVLVYGGRQAYKTYIVPISYPALSSELEIKSIKPEKIYVTLEGQRKSFLFLDSKKIRVQVKSELKKGTQKVRIYQTDFSLPKDLNLEIFAPHEVEFHIDKKDSAQDDMPVNVGKGLVDKIKTILPLKQHDTSSEQTEESLTQPNENNDKPVKKPQVEAVKHLNDAKPEEVVQYLEKTLESDAVIETTKPNEQNDARDVNK